MTRHLTCPLCGVRKAKRECPALGRVICAVCCATKRLTEIPCPESCVYLVSARSHPAAVIQRRQERDLRFFLPHVADLTEPQSRLVLLFQAVLLRHAARADPPLRDGDVAGAAAAVAATLETARKGVIYEHQPESIPAQRLAADWRAALAALGPEPGQVARLETEAAIALRRIAQAAEAAGIDLAGDDEPVFINLAKRLMPEPAGGSGAPGTDDAAGTSETGHRLIIPG